MCCDAVEYGFHCAPCSPLTSHFAIISAFYVLWGGENETLPLCGEQIHISGSNTARNGGDVNVTRFANNGAARPSKGRLA